MVDVVVTVSGAARKVCGDNREALVAVTWFMPALIADPDFHVERFDSEAHPADPPGTRRRHATWTDHGRGSIPQHRSRSLRCVPGDLRGSGFPTLPASPAVPAAPGSAELIRTRR